MDHTDQMNHIRELVESKTLTSPTLRKQFSLDLSLGKDSGSSDPQRSGELVRQSKQLSQGKDSLGSSDVQRSVESRLFYVLKQLSQGKESIESKTPVDLYRSLSKGKVAERSRHATASMDMRTIARFLSEMKVTKPEVLRATPACKALRGCGRALRSNPDPLRLFSLSQRVDLIDEFWSHSWHGESWKKILLLLVLKNGQAAIILGTLASSLALSLFLAGVLPEKIYESGEMNSFWCMAAGVLTSTVTLLCWKCKKLIFLDRVCVNQVDEDEKCEAILSIGALLKSSQAMLVLWDTTYVERLWCVFELAAYIKSHSDMENWQPPTIRPTLLGPCSCTMAVATSMFMLVAMLAPFETNDLLAAVLLLTLGSVGFYTSAVGFRGYYRAIDMTQEQMRNFSVEGAKCACCDIGHTGEGSVMLCDRMIVLSCIDQWYGSCEHFEDAVQSVVRDTLTRQLGQDAFPYAWLVGASTPVLWGMMDEIGTRIRGEKHEVAARLVIIGLAWWMFAFPLLFLVWLKLAHALRHSGGCGYNILMNLIGMAAWMPLLLAVYLFQYATRSLFDNEILSAVVFAATLMGLVVLVRWPYLRWRQKPSEQSHEPPVPGQAAVPDEPAPEPAPEPEVANCPWEEEETGAGVYVHVSL